MKKIEAINAAIAGAKIRYRDWDAGKYLIYNEGKGCFEFSSGINFTLPEDFGIELSQEGWEIYVGEKKSLFNVEKLKTDEEIKLYIPIKYKFYNSRQQIEFIKAIETFIDLLMHPLVVPIEEDTTQYNLVTHSSSCDDLTVDYDISNYIKLDSLTPFCETEKKSYVILHDVGEYKILNMMKVFKEKVTNGFFTKDYNDAALTLWQECISNSYSCKKDE